MCDLDLSSPDQGFLAFCPHHTLSHPSFLSEPGSPLESSKQGDLSGQRGLLDMTTTFSASHLQPGLSCLLSDCSFKDLSTFRLAITSQKPLAFHSLQGKAQTPVLGISAIPASPALGPSLRAGTRDSQPLGPLALTAHPHTRPWEQVSQALVLDSQRNEPREEKGLFSMVLHQISCRVGTSEWASRSARRPLRYNPLFTGLPIDGGAPEFIPCTWKTVLRRPKAFVLCY